MALKLLPGKFETYTTTTEVVRVDAHDNAGIGYCQHNLCGGGLIFSYLATCEDGNQYTFCTLHVPETGSFLRIWI